MMEDRRSFHCVKEYVRAREEVMRHLSERFRSKKNIDNYGKEDLDDDYESRVFKWLPLNLTYRSFGNV